jgi:hypothetical protein
MANMTVQTLLDIENRRPFQPYSLRLNSGDVVRVDTPEHCLITQDGRTLVFNESDGRLKFISIENIAMVEG